MYTCVYIYNTCDLQVTCRENGSRRNRFIGVQRALRRMHCVLSEKQKTYYYGRRLRFSPVKFVRLFFFCRNAYNAHTKLYTNYYATDICICNNFQRQEQGTRMLLYSKYIVWKNVKKLNLKNRQINNEKKYKNITHQVYEVWKKQTIQVLERLRLIIIIYIIHIIVTLGKIVSHYTRFVIIKKMTFHHNIGCIICAIYFLYY